MERVNWGIIGCGNVTEKKSGPAFQRVANSNLVAVMRRNAELAEDYSKRHGVPKWYNSADRLIADSEVDAVYVATPPSSHMEYALKAIEAGKPVYIEKPMALYDEECQRILKAGKESGVPVYVAFYRRALPYFLKIKEILQEGTIADIRCVNVTQLRKREDIDPEDIPWRIKPEISGGGLFHDLGCHTLDVLDMLLGPIISAKGHGVNLSTITGVHDSVSASFQFDNGVLGTGMWCFDAHEDYEFNEIIGTRGKITFTSFTFEPIKVHTSDGVATYTIEPPEHIQEPLIHSIVEELLGNGRALSTGETASRTTWVMDQITGNHKC